MGKGGGGQPQPSQQTVTNTSIPEYARPYVERMLGRSEALATTPYQSYGGERIAGFNDLQNQAFGQAQNLGPAGQLGAATDMATSAGRQFGNMSYDPTSFANQYNAPAAYQTGQFGVGNIAPNQLQQYQMDGAERISGPEAFSPAMAQEYINPYMQNVVDIQKREAQRQADIAASQRAGQAAQVGAFGGSRMGLENAMANRENQRLMSDIQATGSSAAYQQGLAAAQQQFNMRQQGNMQAALANQAAGMNVGQQNLAARLGVQQLGSQQSMQAQLANQAAAQQAQQMQEASRQYGYGQNMNAAQLAAQYGLSAQQAAEQSKQFGSQYGLQTLGQKLQAANTLGQLGQTQFGQEQAGMDARMRAGMQQQGLEQQRIDQQYQDFLNQRGYNQKQQSWFSDMLRGIPMSQSTQAMYQAPPSLTSQMAGLGMAGYGAYKMFGAKDGGLMGLAMNKLEG